MKTPLWLNGIKASAFLTFFALFFASGEVAFWNLLYYQVISIGAIVLFLVSVCIGIFGAISRARKIPVKYLNE